MNVINVFTNKYGIVRSLIAIGSLFTLLFTDPHHYFTHDFFQNGPPVDFPNIFYAMGESNLYIAVAFSVLILLWVISGYLPQITGILHAWVQFSFFNGALLVEGGDQVAQNITILLIPITLFDRRINHWHRTDYFQYRKPEWLEYFCYSCVVIIQVQMCTLYFFAAVEKFKVAEWVGGSAYYYWFNHNPFGASAWLKSLLGFIINSPYLSPIITWSVLILESILFAALFMDHKRKRTLFFAAVAFHCMIMIVHGLNSFFFNMAAGLVLYLLRPDKHVDFSEMKTWIQSISRRPAIWIKMEKVLPSQL